MTPCVMGLRRAFLFATPLILVVTAQAQDLEWARRMGGTLTDYSTSVAVDSSGNVFTVGHFTGTADFDPGPGTFNMTSTGFLDAFIMKVDSAGGFLWAKQIGGNGVDEEAYGIVLDSLGNLYVTGGFWATSDFDPGPGTFNLTSIGPHDVFVLKWDGSGALVWAKRMGGSGDDLGYSIALDKQGNVYTCGYFNGTADFDPGAGTFNLISAGDMDVFISKLDASGNFVWAKRLGGTLENIGYAIALDASGSVFTAGEFIGNADFDPGPGSFFMSSAGAEDIFVSKLNNSGDFVWAKRMGGNSNDIANGIYLDTAGTAYLTGSFSTTADFDPGTATFNMTSFGMTDVFVARLDAPGNFLWAKQIGGTGADIGRGITMDASGRILTTGEFSGVSDFDPSPSTVTLTSAGAGDIFISRLDTLGTFIQAKRQGGSGADVGRSILTDSDHHIYTAGGFSTTGDFDPGVDTVNLTSAGGLDAFTCKLSCTPALAFINTTACDSYTSPSGNHVWTTSGVYQDVLVSASGCDSLITINLTVNVTTSAVISPSACYSYTSPSGNHTWTSSGTYMDTITNISGCDSVLTIQLTIHDSTHGAISPTVCFSYVSPSGNHTWISSGTYTDTVTNMAGCDSILTISLTVNAVDTSITRTDTILLANANGATYQWLDCNAGFTPVPGETGKIFSTSHSGNYAVQVTQSGCVDTSGCHIIDVPDGLHGRMPHDIQVFPNPTSAEVTVLLGAPYDGVVWELTDALGRRVTGGVAGVTDQLTIRMDGPDGIYTLLIRALGVNYPLIIRVVKGGD